MLSDSLPTLENDRADWTMNSIRNADAYETFPADRMEHSHPMIWMGTRKADGQKVMGLFNLTNENMNLNGEFLDAHKSKIIEL